MRLQTVSERAWIQVIHHRWGRSLTASSYYSWRVQSTLSGRLAPRWMSDISCSNYMAIIPPPADKPGYLTRGGENGFRPHNDMIAPLHHHRGRGIASGYGTRGYKSPVT